MAGGAVIEKAPESKNTNHAVSQVNKKTAKRKTAGKSAKMVARKAAKKLAEKKAARKAARKAAEKKAARKAARKAAEKKAAKKAAGNKAARKKADKKQAAGKKSAKNKAGHKRVDKDGKKVKRKAGSTAKDAGQGGKKRDGGEPLVSVVQEPVDGSTFQETKIRINRSEAAAGIQSQASLHDEVQKRSEDLKKMSSDSAQAQELTPAKRAMGFWPKIVVAIIVVIAGFMYIRSIADKDRVMPVADVTSPPPAADIQLEGKGMSDAVPVTIGSVITEEVPMIPAGAPSETEESTNQSEQQAQSESETPAPPMMPETAEAASVEPDQAAAEMPAPETESVMVPPVIPTPPVAPVEQPAQETAVAEESEIAPIAEAEPVFAAPAVEAAQAPGPDVVEGVPGPALMEPAPEGAGMDTSAGYPGGYPPHPSFEEMYGYDRPVPPEMPSRYDRFQGSESQERPKGDYQYPQRMMRRPFPGGMENRSYPGRHPGEYSRGYAPNYDQGYPGERGYGYGPGYSRGYAPPSGYQQGFAPGYPQGYQQGYAPGYSQGYPEDYSQPYPQGQNPYSGGYTPYRW